MKKILTAIFSVAAVGCLAAGLSSCSGKTVVDDFYDAGYTIKVTYEPNGGNFLLRDGVTITDMFNPDDYEAESDGTVKIKLTEPTDPSRPNSSSESITLSNSDHFLIGWYQTRALVTDSDGNALSEDGRKIELEENSTSSYVYSDTKESAVPAYTYSDKWDFSTDTIEYTGEDISMTLYAAWSLNFEFDYYYQSIDGGEWQRAGSTTYVYNTTTNSVVADKNYAFVPEWEDGVMSYDHSYSNGDSYTFPSVEGMTFESAYTDEACTEKIEASVKHEGYVDYEHGVTVNRVKDIYVKAYDYDYYKIEKAEQLLNNMNTAGHYEILADLDFTDLTWSVGFMNQAFTGQIYTADGKQHKFSNISATFSSTANSVGLFGTIASGAVIKNISFENVTIVFTTGNRTADITYGVFAGSIDDDAELSSVEFGDATLRISGTAIFGNEYQFNILACGDKASEKVTRTGKTKIIIYGVKLALEYKYNILKENVTIDKETGNISFGETGKSEKTEEAEYEIEMEV